MVEGVIMDQAKWVTDSFIAFSAYNVTELLKPTIVSYYVQRF